MHLYLYEKYLIIMCLVLFSIKEECKKYKDSSK